MPSFKESWILAYWQMETSPWVWMGERPLEEIYFLDHIKYLGRMIIGESCSSVGATLKSREECCKCRISRLQ